jgi:ATP-dependent exoDNAse (exonuclease V) beta subunit
MTLVGETPVACTIYEPGYQAFGPGVKPETQKPSPADWSPRLLEPVDPDMRLVDERARAMEEDPPRRVWRVVPDVQRPRAPAWVIGQLVHEALAVWRFPGPDFESWLESRAREYGLTDRRQLKDACKKSTLLLERFKQHRLFREVDGAERRLHEVPYDTENSDGHTEHGFIDLLYLRQGLWTVVDFKTDQVRDGTHFNRLMADKKYENQLRRYTVAVEKLSGQRPKAILCMLDYARTIFLYPETRPLPETG